MKIKATLLSPVHIGSGEMYEPTNFVLDGDYLYSFKEENFYKKLPQKDKKEFLKLAESNVIGLWKFIASKKELIKQIYEYKVKVTSGLREDYFYKLGKPTQISRSNQKTFNQFQIQKAIRTPNKNMLYIPGSSIKGAINTALEEMFSWYEEAKYHKEIIVSDAVSKRVFEMIGYALNKERFERDMIGPKTLIEVIMSNPSQKSELEFNIDFKRFKDVDKHLKKEDIIKACNNHYLPLFKSMFEDKEIKRVLGKKFKAEFENIQLKSNQFLLRIGKYSGAKAVTVERKRKILVKFAQVKGRDVYEKLRKLIIKSNKEPEIIEDLAFEEDIFSKKNKNIQKVFWDYYESVDDEESLRKDLYKNLKEIKGFLKEETTMWVFSYKNKLQENSHLPFGWILCEILEK